jgi:hypothetical protein
MEAGVAFVGSGFDSTRCNLHVRRVAALAFGAEVVGGAAVVRLVEASQLVVHGHAQNAHRLCAQENASGQLEVEGQIEECL